jgi:hypothetical protein
LAASLRQQISPLPMPERLTEKKLQDRTIAAQRLDMPISSLLHLNEVQE